MIDGIAVRVGDQVWDTLWGFGTIIDVTPEGSMEVQFGVRRQRYMPGGTIGTSRTQRLFWQDLTAYPRPLPGSVGSEEMRLLREHAFFIRKLRGVPERLPNITEEA